MVSSGDGTAVIGQRRWDSKVGGADEAVWRMRRSGGGGDVLMWWKRQLGGGGSDVAETTIWVTTAMRRCDGSGDWGAVAMGQRRMA